METLGLSTPASTAMPVPRGEGTLQRTTASASQTSIPSSRPSSVYGVKSPVCNGVDEQEDTVFPENKGSPGDNGVVCEWHGCEKIFNSRSKMLRHVREVHKSGGGRVLCEEQGCERVFKDRFSMLRHVEQVHRGGRIPCEEQGCQKTFDSKPKMLRHVKERHTGKRYPCEEQGCERVFKSRPGMLQHVTQVHRGEGVPCEEQSCKRTFVTRHSMVSHYKRMHNGKIFSLVCIAPGCQLMFADRDEMGTHVREVHSICPDCRRTLRGPILQTDLNVCQCPPAVQPTIQCLVCRAQFLGQDALALHTAQAHPASYD